MKAYAVEYSNGHRVDTKRATFTIVLRTFCAAKEVDAETYFAACADGADSWFAKKNETHKRIMVRTGVANLSQNARPVWVRR